MNIPFKNSRQLPSPPEGRRSESATDLFLSFCAPSGDPARPPRTLVAVAHPGDETIGASSRLTRIETAGILYATDGVPSDGFEAHAAGCETRAEYAALRRKEARRALAHVGISSEHAVFLDYPDQQASFNLLSLTADLRRWIAATRPEVLLTHAYEGGHPDHDAVAFAAHAAVGMLTQEGLDAPVLVEFAGYHASGDEWLFSEFIPVSDASSERVVRLATEARALKQRLLACHRSQSLALSEVPVEKESFRLAPAYDFTRPPHDGGLLYERYSWGMSAREWGALAAAALEQLQADQPATV